MSKGSKKRKVDEEQYRKNWDRIFGKPCNICKIKNKYLCFKCQYLTEFIDKG